MRWAILALLLFLVAASVWVWTRDEPDISGVWQGTFPAVGADDPMHEIAMEMAMHVTLTVEPDGHAHLRIQGKNSMKYWPKDPDEIDATYDAHATLRGDEVELQVWNVSSVAEAMVNMPVRGHVDASGMRLTLHIVGELARMVADEGPDQSLEIVLHKEP